MRDHYADCERFESLEYRAEKELEEGVREALAETINRCKWQSLELSARMLFAVSSARWRQHLASAGGADVCLSFSAFLHLLAGYHSRGGVPERQARGGL